MAIAFVGHKTNYKGTIFRSRNEAAKARFFDLLGWSWDYETKETPRWLPDFTLHGSAQDVLVESKPLTSWGDFIQTGTVRKLVDNIMGSEYAYKDIICLAERPIDQGCVLLGWLLRYDHPHRPIGDYWNGEKFVPYPVRGSSGYSSQVVCLTKQNGNYGLYCINDEVCLLSLIPGFRIDAHFEDVQRIWQHAYDYVGWKR